MYNPVSNKSNFSAMEEEILSFWRDASIFEKTLARNPPSGKAYVFYDGPPFATGLPHYGHLLAGTIKDIVPRYQTMRGFHVQRRFGWDCHGLPIEALAQEALGLQGSAEIAECGIDGFNEQCRSMVMRYVDEWKRTVQRMGRWVDFDNDYKTMDRDFMESIWWVFKQLWDQGRVYRSYRIMPYSWKLNTPLSNFEAGGNYKDVQDPAVTVRVRITDPSAALPAADGIYLLIWTTTPWTLPGNLAICAGPDIEYVCVRDLPENTLYLLARSRLEAVFPDPGGYRVEATLPGSALEGCGYDPLFPNFASQPRAFRVLTDDFVTAQDGTGLVHMAPAYGEDDFRVCREAGIDLIDYLDADCRFNSSMPEFEGTFCKDADRDIIRLLKKNRALVHQTTLTHSYPFCERTDTPLIYRAIDSWYLRVEDMRERLERANQTVHWMPEHVGEKRFGNWLRDARDWNISRNRFWGSCIPVWISEDGEEMICVGSIEELERLSGTKISDLHKHHLDAVEIRQGGKIYRRTPEVLDCWFESGAMPLAQQHYPFENAEHLDRFFPADFIAEGLDQTRGWFYTLLTLSVALFDRAPYRNVVVNGLVLAEDGRKMSKRLKNYPDPGCMIDSYGADALRLYMIHSPVVRAENLRFSEEGVKHVLRHIMIPWWNAYSFFVTYANIDGWEEEGLNHPDSRNLLDRWIVSSLETLIACVADAMDRYDLQRSVRPFVHFIEDLTNWYIRRSRRRFWKSSDDEDKDCAYRTLRYVLIQLSKVAAPFVPFISERVYRNLRSGEMPESVHLCDFPSSNTRARDAGLEEKMGRVQTIVALGRQLRTDHDLKVRQPLARLHVVCTDKTRIDALDEFESIIAEELNVKRIRFDQDDSGLAELSLKPDFRRLGPRFGKAMPKLAKAIASLPEETARVLASGQPATIPLNGEAVELLAEDVIVERTPLEGLVVAVSGDIIVALETALTEDLVQEGLAREFVSKIQAARKQAEFEVTQRIGLRVRAGEELCRALEAHHEYIRGETLARSLVCEAGETAESPKDFFRLDINGRDGLVRLFTATEQGDSEKIRVQN